MLGLGDWSVAAAIFGSLGATLFGVIYGAVNWNRGDDSAGLPHRRHHRRKQWR